MYAITPATLQTSAAKGQATHIRCEGPPPVYPITVQPGRFWRVFPADRHGAPVSPGYVQTHYTLALLLMRRIARDRGHMPFKVVHTSTERKP